MQLAWRLPSDLHHAQSAMHPTLLLCLLRHHLWQGSTPLPSSVTARSTQVTRFMAVGQNFQPLQASSSWHDEKLH